MQQHFQQLRERMVAFAASRYAGASAEDLAQEVLMLLHTKYPHVTELSELLPLAFQIMRFKLAAHWRTISRHGEMNTVDAESYDITSPDGDPLWAAQQRERLELLSKALLQLGERCREIFKYKLQGKGFIEIQKIMQIPNINTLYTWDSRCRKELLNHMGESWEAEKG